MLTKYLLKGDMLSEEDSLALRALAGELQDTWLKRQLWRTETEMRVSVLNDLHFPTPASKYWQAVREQSVFLENLAQLDRDYRRNEIEIRKLHKAISSETDGDTKELLGIDLEEKEFNSHSMSLAAKDRMRELKLWSSLKQEFDDGTFDTKDVNTHQLVSYGQRFARQMSLTDPTSMSPSEYHNLAGQFYSVVNVAKKTGVLDEILAVLSPDIALKLVPENVRLT